MDATKKRNARLTRHLRIRRRVRGTADKPRLSVFRSNTNIYAQLIDDVRGHTLVAASSRDADVSPEGATKVDAAREVGKVLAQRATEAGITTCVFDRGGNRYAGRIAALAEGARDAGLEF